MEQKNNDDYQQVFIKQLFKSYLEESKETKLDILSFSPEIESIIDDTWLEQCKYSPDDTEWKLKDGNTYESTQLLIFPPIAFIKALLGSESLSLFQCIFLVGYTTRNKAISNSIDITNNAISKGIISPRDPDTNLKRNEAPAIRLNGELVIPDLSWLLTFEEAEQWAVNSFGVSFKALRDKLADGIQTAKQNELTPDKKPSYLNEDHPMFSRELTIAVEAWEQVLSSNPDKPKTGSRKKLITQWLENNHKELTSEAKERIAVMINPDGNGGVPKSQAF